MELGRSIAVQANGFLLRTGFQSGLTEKTIVSLRATPSMQSIEQKELSVFFKSIKKPVYVLGTTYSLSLAFFESVVSQCMNKTALKRCLIISDSIGYQRALTESPALRGAGQNYLVVPAPIKTTFHPKVWLVMDDENAALLAGSGNLTQSGFMDNAELFDAVLVSKREPAAKVVLDDILTFLQGLQSMWLSEGQSDSYCLEMLEEMAGHLKTFPTSNKSSSIRFLSSFGGPLISQLPKAAASGQLYVAAPYFGGTLDGLSLLSSRYRNNISVFPGILPDDVIDLPASSFSEAYPESSLAALDLAKKKERTAHLKLYGYTGRDEDNWIFCTSANCTKAALSGQNIEAGLLRHLQKAEVEEYFQPDKNRELPTRLLTYEGVGGRRNSVHLTAVESATGIEVEVNQGADRLPFRNARITVRCGSQVMSTLRPTVFERNCFETIRWADFADGSHPRGMAATIEIDAEDGQNNSIRAACFIENRTLLAADPIHRSAFRGALTLLERDGMPVSADIAAIFTLVHQVFDGRLAQAQVSVNTPQELRSDILAEKEDALADILPLWPPQAASTGHSSLLLASGAGHLQWCQKILEVFLKPPTQSPIESAAPVNQSELDDDTEEEGRESQIAELQQLQKISHQIWKEASRTFDSLLVRLGRLVPNEIHAQDVYPVSIFLLLATLAVRQSAIRAEQMNGDIPTADNLLTRFMAAIFDYRKQPEDFCPPSGIRYRGSLFPPLAEDIWYEFHMRPHMDLTLVLYAVLATRVLKEGVVDHLVKYSVQIRMLSGEDFALDDCLRAQCQNIWHQWMREPGSLQSESDFLQALRIVEAVGWTEHSGFRQVFALRTFASTGRIDTTCVKVMQLNLENLHLNGTGRPNWALAAPSSVYCNAKNCQKRFIETPAFHRLRELKPVICESCGTIYVPKPFEQAAKSL